MNIDITTPALLFPAITLLMLAHTNRFLALANLVRQFRALYDEKPDDRVFKQIENFQKRLNILKYRVRMLLNRLKRTMIIWI